MISYFKKLIFTLSSEYCGPDVIGGISDLAIVIISIIVVFLSFYLCIKFFIWPGEENQDHIKRKVLSERND
jgi:hypothetical protein